MRVTAYGRRTGETAWEEIKPLTRLDLIYDRYEPCAQLELETAGAGNGRAYQEALIKLGDAVLFEGFVDIQTLVRAGGTKRRLLQCRGLSAVMADNQPKPGTYYRLTPQTAFQQFAQPYGLRGVRFSGGTEQGFLIVERGMTCWDAMDLYCRQTFRSPLYVTPDGYLMDTASGVEDVVWISNQRADSLRYSSVKFARNRKEMISRVYLKSSYDVEDADFTISQANATALIEGVERERYLFPGERWYRDLSRCGKDTLSRSNIHFKTLEAILPGLRNIGIGSIVKFPEEEGGADDEHRAYHVHLHDGDDGPYTKLKTCIKYFF